MIEQKPSALFRSLTLAACSVVVFAGCEEKTTSTDALMAAADKSQIEAEVRQALDDYAAAVVAGDQETVKAFWGDFDDFVHAGDGRVMGDRETWLTWIDTHPSDVTSWKFSDVHIAVLGSNAASYTANFEVVSVGDGSESKTTGSWTYVLRKTAEGWKVVHSNGRHNEFSYYD